MLILPELTMTLSRSRSLARPDWAAPSTLPSLLLDDEDHIGVAREIRLGAGNVAHCDASEAPIALLPEVVVMDAPGKSLIGIYLTINKLKK